MFGVGGVGGVGWGRGKGGGKGNNARSAGLNTKSGYNLGRRADFSLLRLIRGQPPPPAPPLPIISTRRHAKNH